MKKQLTTLTGRQEETLSPLTRRAFAQTVGGGLAISAAGVSWLHPRLALGDEGVGATPKLGINLAPVRFWGSERPFQNLFMASSPHVPLREGGKWNAGGPLKLSENGWIEHYQPGQHSAFVIDLGRGTPKGEYRVQFSGPTNAIRLQKSRDNRTVTKVQDRQRLMAHVHHPIKDVVVHETSHQVDGVFAKRFLDRCRPFQVLRFMDWGGVNEQREVAWETRVTKDHYTQAGEEVALEYMVELCNATDSGMWYCVHHLADDTYVQKAAEYIKSELRPGLSVYLEHSNEVWNGMFPQQKYCRERSSTPLEYHVRRTAEIATLFRKAGVELTSVLGFQCAGTWAAGKSLENGCPDEIDATAIAPYFGGFVGRKPEVVKRVMQGGMETVVEECEASIELRRQEIAKHREIADQHGLRVLGYEGGQHLVAVGQNRKNKELVQLLTSANRDPVMYDLYRSYIAMWQEATDNDLMCLYYSVGEYSESGSWGLMEYDGQPLSAAHKFRAVHDMMHGS